MADWMNWFLAAGLLLILEMLSGTFYLLMFAIGVACGGLAALAGAALPWQTVLAAVIGVLATLLLRRSRYGKPNKTNAARDPNVNMDIGQSVTVQQWQDGFARVMYRGALWDVELAPGATASPGTFTIREIRGSRLIVA